MNNSMQKSRYEAPEAEELELVMEDFLVYPNDLPGGEEDDDDSY